jgi:hypothetical protein
VEFNGKAPIASWFLAHVLLEKGAADEADHCLSATLEAAGGSGIHLGLLAFAKARSGKESEARELTSRLEEAATIRYISPFDLGTAYLGLREHDTAIKYIHRAISERVMRVTELPMPLFDEMRSDPKVAEFCEQLSVR